MFNLVAHLQRQLRWSLNTFGPGARTQGILDHIRKELGEIERAPLDLSEWIDVVILGFDGAWRAGYTPVQIVDALVEKQTKNESRIWPDWRAQPQDKAIEHIRHNCYACTHSYAEPDSDLICGHEDSGQFGLSLAGRSAPNKIGGHCGPDLRHFRQHPLRNPNGTLKDA